MNKLLIIIIIITETSGSVTKCRLFSQTIFFLKNSTTQTFEKKIHSLVFSDKSRVF